MGLTITSTIPDRYRSADQKACDHRTQTHCGMLERGVIPQIGAVYTGPRGTGKTYAMYAIARQAERRVSTPAPTTTQIRNGFEIDVKPKPERIAIVKFRDLLDGFRSCTFDRGGSSVSDMVSDLCEHRFLFLDDMTIRVVERAPESPYLWAYEAMNHLVDSWWDTGKPGGLYITTNNTLAELADAFGEPMLDRIWAMCERIELSGSTKRQRGML